MDRSGKEEALPLPAREYTYARLSPEGRRIALDIRDQDQDIWVWDIERRTLTRLTFDPNPDGSPVWTTDGKRIIFAQHTGELTNMAWQAADGSGQPERLTEGGRRQNPMAVTPDGTRLLFREVNAEASGDLYLLSLVGARRPVPFIQTRFEEGNPAISPDGRWVAYLSNESGGRNDIYVRPFPDVDTGRWQVSAGGGLDPLWSRDGRELFFTAPGPKGTRVMVAAIAAGPGFSAAAPRQLFEGPYYDGGTAVGPTRPYDISPDGKRLLMLKNPETGSRRSTDAPLVIVLNFFDELRRLAPATP